MRVFRISLLLLGLGLVSCDRRPTSKEIASRFKADHPEVSVVEVRIGNGDKDGLEYFIDYRTAADSERQTAEWLVHYGDFSDWGYIENDFRRKSRE